MLLDKKYSKDLVCKINQWCTFESMNLKEVSPFLCSWSGGKDSCYAMHLAVRKGMVPKVLLTVLNEHGDRSRSHGITREILETQAEALNLPIHFFESTWSDYEQLYIENLKNITTIYTIQSSVFGDIDIESHKEWEEKVSNEAGLQAILPLWQESRKKIVLDMIDVGVEAIIVSCNQQLGPSFLGRKVDETLIKDLENLEVDVCGENGEYHTLVTDAPLFKNKIEIKVLGHETSSNYNFARLKMI